MSFEPQTALLWSAFVWSNGKATEGVKQGVNLITRFFKTETGHDNGRDQGRSGWRWAWQEAFAWGQARAGRGETAVGALAWEKLDQQRILSLFMD